MEFPRKRKSMLRQPRTKAPAAGDVIAELARQTQRPVDEVKAVYERELNELESYATVKTYLPVLAKRRARDTLSGH
jgi:hypothetical protein